MSTLKEYQDQEKERQEVAGETNQHYLSVNLPGDRSMTVETESVRARIAAMKVEKDKPNHEVKK
ncbi:MAG: hypothetical protein AAFZ63_00880 [Bacteroidota bacterium]